MALLLAIETTTKNCSVALFENSNLLQLKEKSSDKYSHAEQLTLFIEAVVKKSKITLKEIDGIVLSKGPGSYTGLRIGTSTAKGLCYSLDIPLVSVSTLKTMAFGMSEKEDYRLYCPMIDARRMEVFASIYDQGNNEAREIRADIVDENTYAEFLQDKVLFFGDGALKCKSIINNPNAYFIDGVFPSAKDMGILGFEKFANKDFEDVAYFEPYYLKDFVVGEKKKS
ncbi:MAG: tRNA (adenosine(37)-N6)-threonylcarbamoyltransferase complex dimerization subunit type 1 TsaB [Bacteroidota bacterium]|nr:tRNA (adenosine(37)-N6)-threonylcarbamoyltransferase complex dimerization subunit type 1 TsaB [Bacteroidota bacterium]MEC9209672.1 tRNA (adenosine(37)-N6)-threonylcarbamoyltransferase complex dimerization subunit type 1 TsaB [Bacteroidota bacterium]